MTTVLLGAAVYKHALMLCSRSSLTHDSAVLSHNYQLDLSSLRLLSRVGILRCADGTLHYYLDGIDQGPAFSSVPSGCIHISCLF